MSKNYMADVAKMLGVEIGEEFNLVDKDGIPSAYNPFHIEARGFIDCTGDDDAGFLIALLTGDFEIVKKPWKPKTDGTYYAINPLNKSVVGIYWWDNQNDEMLYLLGNCFKTRSEAEKNIEAYCKYLEAREPDVSWRVK